MKSICTFLVLFCITCCKEKAKEKFIIETNDPKDKFSELKAEIGLPKSYTDTLSLISYHFDDVDNDKKFLKIDYKKKLDSLYKLIDEELNIIGFEDHFIEDARKRLEELKESYVIEQKAANSMWNTSYGTNYREHTNDENALIRIEQMIYKRRYEELLIYNYHLRSNLTRWWESPNTFRYKKRLEDLAPKKFLDSMYPKRKNFK